ncbi:MAG TPA: BREX system Lon protease-like protein BrxL [bacterium]|nr:BREX system Lon protease-like protein BrxL [bacterium]
MQLDEKLKNLFPNLVVNKKLALTKEVSRLPRFISEYLITKFLENDKLNTEKLYNFLKEHYISPEERNDALHQLRKEGIKIIMDEFYVEMKVSGGIASEIIPGLHIPSFQINNAWVKEEVLDNNRDLLRGGMWGLGKIELSRNILLITHSIDTLSFPYNFKNIFLEIFIQKLEECGFEIITTSNKDPLFISNYRKIFQQIEETGKNSFKIDDIPDEIIIRIGQELLANYIFKPFIVYQRNEKVLSLQIQYYSMAEKRWKLFENKEGKVNTIVEEEIKEFIIESVVKFIEKEKITPGFYITLTEFTPYQISSISVNPIISNRKEFSIEDWKDIIIRSIGLEPKNYSPKQKLLVLTRLIPLIEANVNLIEFGPKATGKTYIYRNSSIYTRIFAGGKVSPAQIFYHGTYKTIGEIVRRDCIIFDELSKVILPEEMISKLKDYMVDGFFERLGLKRAHSECSLVFIDNVAANNIDNLINEDIHPIIRDTAFLDRIHAFIQGWELPKILTSDEHLAQGFGFTSDVLCEFFHQMKTKNFIEIIDEKIKLIGETITIRDEKAIKKISAGLLKILFPDKNINNEELLEIVEFAIELRQNVNKLLYKLLPFEFSYRNIKCQLK